MDFGLFFLMQRDERWSERAVYGLCPAPPVLASFVAARTSTLRLGMGVSLLVSGGRLDVGIGRGGTLHDYQTFRCRGSRPRSRCDRCACSRKRWRRR